MKPLHTIDSVETPDGTLALRQRGERDFLITIAGRVLMTSTARRSEQALGTLGCSRLSSQLAPRVLVGGLGMGFTLRAVLDLLPRRARVVVAELNPITETWCRGPLAVLTGGAIADPRVELELVDVMQVIARASLGPPQGRFDAISFDLYVGPDAGTKDHDPLYGTRAVAQAASALNAGGILSVWGEEFNPGYEKRLVSAGFEVRHERPGRGGRGHVVYVAQKRAR